MKDGVCVLARGSWEGLVGLIIESFVDVIGKVEDFVILGTIAKLTTGVMRSEDMLSIAVNDDVSHFIDHFGADCVVCSVSMANLNSNRDSDSFENSAIHTVSSSSNHSIANLAEWVLFGQVLGFRVVASHLLEVMDGHFFNIGGFFFEKLFEVAEKSGGFFLSILSC